MAEKTVVVGRGDRETTGLESVRVVVVADGDWIARAVVPA
jgi:hypothetical protein